MHLGTIVIVEDDRKVGLLVRTALLNATLGYSIELVGTGAKGINSIKARWTPLAIVDYYLPDISGIDVIRKVKRVSPQTKIIATSGATGSELRAEISGAGADYFLPKPFSLEELMLPVRDLLHISLAELQ